MVCMAMFFCYDILIFQALAWANVLFGHVNVTPEPKQTSSVNCGLGNLVTTYFNFWGFSVMWSHQRINEFFDSHFHGLIIFTNLQVQNLSPGQHGFHERKEACAFTRRVSSWTPDGDICNSFHDFSDSILFMIFQIQLFPSYSDSAIFQIQQVKSKSIRFLLVKFLDNFFKVPVPLKRRNLKHHLVNPDSPWIFHHDSPIYLSTFT